ncbi:hypothetical protein [Microbacterium hydrocarbonoxydans]|jgi:hypothetical protein|uniref:hypothetical protein n=1 Tax=Microbacterium hydrocarbonoxydans TaxID=273678 RepID=UPI003D96ACE1
MSQPGTVTPEPKNTSLLIRGSIWIAIGALIAAALVCVVWVLIGDQDGLIGRAFLTILLLAGFAGIAILEAGLAPNRPDWLALASMVSWIIALIVGAFKIWLPEDGQFFSGGERFFQLLLVIGILQLALLHVRLFTPAASRYVTVFTRIIYIATIVFLVGLVGMLLFYLTFTHNFVFGDLFGRILVALTILTAVGTTLIPLLNALFAPKKQPTPVHQVAAATAAWPTYADGRTPLPALPDGNPDWNAYYTGFPSVPQLAAPVGGGYQQAPAYPGQSAAPQYQAQPLPELPIPAAPQEPVVPQAAAFAPQPATAQYAPQDPATPQYAAPAAPQEPLAAPQPAAIADAAPVADPQPAEAPAPEQPGGHGIPPVAPPAPGVYPPAPPLPPQ